MITHKELTVNSQVLQVWVLDPVWSSNESTIYFKALVFDGSSPTEEEISSRGVQYGFKLQDYSEEIYNNCIDLLITHPVFLGETPPPPYYAWGVSSGAWCDVRPVSKVRSAAWTRIKRHRDAQEFAPFTYNGNTFDGDATAQRRLASLISLSKSALSVGEPFSYPWKTAANQMVMLTAQDFVAMELAKVQQFGAAFLKAETLRGQIEAAETAEQLDAIQW